MYVRVFIHMYGPHLMPKKGGRGNQVGIGVNLNPPN
jgi:hypothetical protein